MEAAVVRRNMDSMNQPMVVQPYILPPFNTKAASGHDRAVYSMWMHFIDHCHQSGFDANTVVDPINRHTGRSRLPIFIALASASTAYRATPEGYKPSRGIELTPIRLYEDEGFGDSPTTIADIELFDNHRTLFTTRKPSPNTRASLLDAQDRELLSLFAHSSE